MVILAGSGHLAFGSGIPKRLERRTHMTYAVVLNSGVEMEPHVADYILLTKKEDLPPAGVLGVSLQEKGRECRILLLVPGGAAEKAGLKRNDVLRDIEGQKVSAVADMRLALWDKKPGGRVRVSVRRTRRFGPAATHSFEVELAAPAKTPQGS
jgi:S1-C subfamily serine protease